MLRSLKNLLNSLTAPAAGDERSEHTLQLATAVLLVEVMRADTEMPQAERVAVLQGLRDKFALADDELQQLLKLAEEAARTSTGYFEFTSQINRHFDMPQKLRIIELMWRVAYADGRLGAHEQHVMWRIADLLHVPHGAYVNAKMRAQRDA